MNDEQLAICCKHGERYAVEQLVEKYYLPLKAFFYKLSCNSAVSEDLTHNVVIKFLQNIGKYNPVFGAKFSTWLFKIAYNEYLNHLRRNPANREILLDEGINEISDASDISEAVEERLARQALRKRLLDLPEEVKTLIILRYYNAFSYSEISKITGMHTGKVKWKLHDAVEKLGKAVKHAEGGRDIGYER